MSRRGQKALPSGLLLVVNKVLPARRLHRISLETLTCIASCLRKVSPVWKYNFGGSIVLYILKFLALMAVNLTHLWLCDASPGKLEVRD